jgi:hypothetical protein
MLQHIGPVVPVSWVAHKGHLNWAAAVYGLENFNICAQCAGYIHRLKGLELREAPDEVGVRLAQDGLLLCQTR